MFKPNRTPDFWDNYLVLREECNPVDFNEFFEWIIIKVRKDRFNEVIGVFNFAGLDHVKMRELTVLLTTAGKVQDDKSSVLLYKELPGICKKTLHVIHGRIVEAINQGYRECDYFTLARMAPVTFDYLKKFNVYKIEDIVKFYGAGAFSDHAMIDVECLMQEVFTKFDFPELKVEVFGSQVKDLLKIIPEDKWKYIKTARSLSLPHSIAEKLGRSTRPHYQGNLHNAIDKMEATGHYTENEIQYLHDMVEEEDSGIESDTDYFLTISRIQQITRDLYMKFM